LALCPRPKKAGARESRGEKRDPLDQFLEAASGDLSLSLSGLLRPDAVKSSAPEEEEEEEEEDLALRFCWVFSSVESGSVENSGKQEGGGDGRR
jgi:hypothetical protein